MGDCFNDMGGEGVFVSEISSCVATPIVMLGTEAVSSVLGWSPARCSKVSRVSAGCFSGSEQGLRWSLCVTVTAASPDLLPLPTRHVSLYLATFRMYC